MDIDTMRYSTRFEALQAETEEILSATTRTDICEAVSNSIHKLLDSPHSQMYLYSRREESLTTLSALTTIESGCEDEEALIDVETVHKEDESTLWDVYTSNECELLKDSTDISRLITDECNVNSGIMLPLGPYGVLFVVEREDITFTDIDVSIGEFLAAATTRALDGERRDRGLAMVQAISRDAMTAETHTEMSDMILSQLPEVLDYPLCAIWKYNPYEHQLEPVGTTGPAQEVVPDHPVFKPGNSIAWDVFETGGTRVISDVASYPKAYNEDSPIKSEVITAIGDFGVFAAGSTRGGSFNDTEKQIIDSLSTNLQAIVELVERHGELQLLDEVLGRVIRHNIRNELNVIKGNGKILHESHEDSDSSEMYYTEFTEACERLDETAKNAQLMRKVVRNRDNKIDVDVTTAVKNAVTDIREEFPKATVTFQTDCTDECPTLSLHLNFEDCIKELLVNGIRHNDTADQPVVDVTVNESDHAVSVTISDNGPGIPQVEQSVLSDKSESTLRHGSGAGLWVVDRVVSYSGGVLNFSVDKGTTAELLFSKQSA